MNSGRCPHDNVVDPPTGKCLRVCLDCLRRLIECDTCDAVIVAGHDDIGDWTKHGTIQGESIMRWTSCPNCSN